MTSSEGFHKQRQDDPVGALAVFSAHTVITKALTSGHSDRDAGRNWVQQQVSVHLGRPDRYYCWVTDGPAAGPSSESFTKETYLK